MAVDDITTIISANLAAQGTTDRQPASGVEEMILDVGLGELEGTAPNAVQALKIDITEGSNFASLINGNSATQANHWFRGKMVGDNTNYFRFYNYGAGASDLTYAVIAIG